MSPTSERLPAFAVLWLALAMPVTALITFGDGTSFDEAVGGANRAPMLIQPAGYAFAIWGYIYAMSVVFGIYQAAPGQDGSALLRRIRPWAGSAFAAICAWLVCARLGRIWGTVACIVWLLVSLLPIARAVSRPAAGRAHTWVLSIPFGVFAGWISVATFANVLSGFHGDGWLDRGLGETGWTVLALLAAAVLAVAMTRATRGNAGYAAAVVWALVAIGVGNLQRGPDLAVTVTAFGLAALEIFIWLYTRRMST